MFVGIALMYNKMQNRLTGVDADHRSNERGAAVVEWLGISALSIGLLVVIFQAMELLGVELVDNIRSQLGL